jgi:hypothetical protein
MRKLTVIIVLIFILTLSFSGCSFDIKSKTKEIKYKTKDEIISVYEVPNVSEISVIEIPDEYEGKPVTVIEDFAAVNLEYVTKIIIGKNISEIGGWAFTNNQKLVEFAVDEENEYFCSVDGVLYSKDKLTLIAYPPAKALEYTVIDGVETIRSKAFYKCSKIESVTLPDTVKNIEEKAFFRCEKMTDFAFSSNIEFIGKDAFAYCTGLKSIEIPKTIVRIDEYAFFNCTSLNTVSVDKFEAEIQLGEKWYPTKNGLEKDDLVINWKE